MVITDTQQQSNSNQTPSVVIETLGAKTSETEEGLKKINNYLLKREIGHGAFGTVHFGINTLTNKEYAIKEFSKSRLRRKEQLAMLRRGRGGKPLPPIGTNPLDLVRSELAILKKLNHHNVIKLYEVLDDPDNDSLYMVLEMAHKGVIMQIDLNQSTTPYTEKASRFYFRQIILGIEYLHCNDVVHRDIKPDNLLLSDNKILKIVDFGVSEIFVKGDDALQSTAGSPAFMPPELCTANRGPVSGKAADIWSMGVTLYCLVHGHLPFTNQNLLGLYEMIEHDPVTYSKNLSPTLIDLLQNLLEKNPQKRIAMRELRNHPWVTNNGLEPMISEEDNCHSVLSEITDEDIQSAITSVRHIFRVMQAVAKFKRHSRSLSGTLLSNVTSDDTRPGAIGEKRNKIDTDNTYLFPYDDSQGNTHVINIMDQHHQPLDHSKVPQIQPIIVERKRSRSFSPPPIVADVSSTFSSTISSNSSVLNTPR
ncbi:MAG: kinase-like domain-containing protein [Benjaminiella poitrasii]|nr:MAG: kinase-like domain-containing protein [Benjaminiella poitrasii]